MKNKLLVMMVMLIGSLIIISGVPKVYAATCANCMSNSHGGCANGTYNKYWDATWHMAYCRCCNVEIQGGNSKHNKYTEYASSYIEGQCYRERCSGCSGFATAWTGHNLTGACSKCGELITCGTCGKSAPHTCNPHTHSYSTRVIEAATCTEGGLEETYCSCGDSYTSSTPALGHNWGGYIANGASGHYRVCSRCGEQSSTQNHSFSDLQVSVKHSNSHSRICYYCDYETDVESHNIIVEDYGSTPRYHHDLVCNICYKYRVLNQACSMTTRVIKQATCTSEGSERHTCSVCGQYYDSSIPKINHDWSGWKTDRNEHWKVCEYGCGTETSRGNHIDTNPKDAYCDTCNYLMYIVPKGTVSGGGALKEGETASFFVNVTEGTQPISYQWYYKTSSSGTGIEMSGETASSLLFTATKAMNGRYYYCVLSNPGGSYTTNAVGLTVYYKFTISPQPVSVELKKGETGTFTVGIGEHGNPDSYTYQWYVANSATGGGSKIANATTNTCSVTPTKNIHAEYYYCIVSNGQYEVTSNRAKLVADITEPKVELGSFDDDLIINKTATLKIPLIVMDWGEGYTENNNFIASEVIVKVGGVSNSVSKTLTYKGALGDNYYYELTLTNINGNGKLSLEIPENSFEDNFGNKNISTNFSTNVTIDNIAPTINLESVTGDINEKYINADDTLTIKLSVIEGVGINLNEFTIDDIIVKIGGTPADTSLQRTFKYIEKIGNKYIYELTLTNIKGDGLLTLNIPNAVIKDLATNTNVETELPITLSNNEVVIVDNTAPTINSVVTTLGAYNNTSRVYPDSLLSIHNNWANEDIYVQINAEDNQKIECYMKSIGTNNNFARMDSNRELIAESIDSVITYRVVDMAGNYTEASQTFKLDKIIPNKPVISLFEQRQNGANYIYNADKPTDKSIYVIPNQSTIVDAGNVKSGIETDIAYTYYIINSYSDLTKTETIASPITLPWNEGFLLDESGYYEIQMTMTDIAGNQIISDIYKVYINKKAENTIRIKNINDIGSGINKVTIKVFESDASGNKTSIEAIDEMVIENPYKEIIKNVRLGEGKFYVEVTLEDKVGLTTVLEKTITNNL